jgi:hypothetical protein
MEWPVLLCGGGVLALGFLLWKLLPSGSEGVSRCMTQDDGYGYDWGPGVDDVDDE